MILLRYYVIILKYFENSTIIITKKVDSEDDYLFSNDSTSSNDIITLNYNIPRTFFIKGLNYFSENDTAGTTFSLYTSLESENPIEINTDYNSNILTNYEFKIIDQLENFEFIDKKGTIKISNNIHSKSHESIDFTNYSSNNFKVYNNTSLSETGLSNIHISENFYTTMLQMIKNILFQILYKIVQVIYIRVIIILN